MATNETLNFMGSSLTGSENIKVDFVGLNTLIEILSLPPPII